MTTTMSMTVAAAETSRGWGGPLAILVAVVVFGLIAGTSEWMRNGRDAPSPTGEGTAGVGVNPQVSGGVDTDDTDRDTGWWGTIRTVGGRRVRVVDHDVDDDQDDDEEQPTMEDVVDQLEAAGRTYMEVVRHLQDEFEVSESTAKRVIRNARAARAE